jgi:predicted unusual protein kinase regulating ubiquinone biosynthesis (AarF/ABC1/UbiB family)
MLNSLKDSLKQIIFFINIGFIISYETLFYIIFNDYISFIHRITNKLASINILYVKIFQAVACNNNLIDEKINTELLKFTDNAPWNHEDLRTEELYKIIDKYDLVINDEFKNPINSGMISLVYKCSIKNNNIPIIIKMKRNNIENKLNNAIANLKIFIYILSFIPIIHKYEISKIVNNNIKIILDQTNFNKEVENIKKIRNNCKNLKYVKIPYVYEDVTKKNSNFIVMDYINGIKINEILESDYNNFATQFLKFCFTTTLYHGISHGDLHSGNILFIKDENDEKYKYKVGIIDFGILYEIDEEFKNTIFHFFTNLFIIPKKESVIYLLNSPMVYPPNSMEIIPKENYTKIVEVGTQLLNGIFDGTKKGNQIQLYEFLVKFNEYLNDPKLSNYGIRPSDSFINMQFVLAMVNGVTITICKDNIVELFNKVINELFHTDLLME